MRERESEGAKERRSEGAKGRRGEDLCDLCAFFAAFAFKKIV
jgi:hypothetical protein